VCVCVCVCVRVCVCAYLGSMRGKVLRCWFLGAISL
jgi:hypothetical protein